MKYNRLYFLDKNQKIAMCSFGALNKIRKEHELSLVYYFPSGNIWARNVVKWIYYFRSFKRRRVGDLVVCANELSEMIWLRFFGIDSILANQNMNCNEHIFTPNSNNMHKVFDAVYSAMLAPFKRIPLASEINKLYIITYKIGSTGADLHKEYPEMRHAQFNEAFLSEIEVRNVYNKSRCGLALSKREGAMWASIEYQLCGLPIVSTKARGGRFHYFDPETWVIAPSTKDGVYAAVNEAVNRGLDSWYVRARSLQRVKSERIRFLRNVQTRANKIKMPGLLGYEKVYSKGIQANSLFLT